MSLSSLVLAGVVASTASTQVRDTVLQFPLPLLDMGIQASARYGVLVGAAPSIHSKQGADSLGYVALQFHPDSLMDWAGHAAVVLNRPLVTEDAERIQWTRELRDIASNGSLTLGRGVRKGKLRDARWLSLGDSTRRWSLELSGQQADSLLHLLTAVATVSGPPDTVTAGFCADSVDTPVVAISQPKPRFAKVFGRVLAHYVVDTAGRADPESIVFLLSSSPVLEQEARTVLLKSRYQPAIRRGRPVRQVVQQVLVWRYR